MTGAALSWRMSGEQQVDSNLIDEWTWSESSTLPMSVDVAIIGGGIVGCSAAYFLAREGLSQPEPAKAPDQPSPAEDEP